VQKSALTIKTVIQVFQGVFNEQNKESMQMKEKGAEIHQAILTSFFIEIVPVKQ
jgi:hypothetical protein